MLHHRPSLLVVAVLSAFVATSAGGCSDRVSVSFSTGPLTLALGTEGVAIPTPYRTGDGRIDSVACSAMAACTSEVGVPISCVSGVCNPDLVTFGAPVGSVIDVTMLSGEFAELDADTLEITEGSFLVELNSLSIDLREVQIFWGPEEVADIGPGTTLLGAVPAVPARAMPMGMVDIDPEGMAALSAHLLSNSRARFFAQTSQDLDPGGPYPEGAIRVTVGFVLRASGSLL